MHNWGAVNPGRSRLSGARMPVIGPDGQLVGMVSLEDLLNARAKNLTEERERECVLRIRVAEANGRG